MKPVLSKFLRQKARPDSPDRRILLPKTRAKRGRSPIGLFLFLILWCLILGVGLAHATEPAEIGTVDPIPERLELAQEVYLENCATCHIGVPPQVLPTQTWRELLQNPQHFGVQLDPILQPSLTLVWTYLQNFSRPYGEEEVLPYNIDRSRFFRALHPRVELERPVQLRACISCHPGANAYNFRQLSPEWEDAP